MQDLKDFDCACATLKDVLQSDIWFYSKNRKIIMEQICPLPFVPQLFFWKKKLLQKRKSFHNFSLAPLMSMLELWDCRIWALHQIRHLREDRACESFHNRWSDEWWSGVMHTQTQASSHTHRQAGDMPSLTKHASCKYACKDWFFKQFWLHFVLYIHVVWVPFTNHIHTGKECMWRGTGFTKMMPKNYDLASY